MLVDVVLFAELSLWIVCLVGHHYVLKTMTSVYIWVRYDQRISNTQMNMNTIIWAES